MSTADVSPETLRNWLTAIDADLDSVTLRMQPLLAEQASLNERRVLVQGLLASVTGDAAPIAITGSSAGESVRQRVHRQAVDVLTAAGKPLHINMLKAEFQKRGYPIPGLGQPANISVHLANWDDISSPERGVYALKK
jgi:hypothetical protein